MKVCESMANAIGARRFRGQKVAIVLVFAAAVPHANTDYRLFGFLD